MTRGIRNRNPGNIRVGSKWDGLMDPKDMNKRQKAEKAFCVFKSPEYGIRAMCRILRTYQRHYNLTTVRQIIARWAPANENDVDAYVRYVTNRTNFRYAVDVESYPDLKLMVEAMIEMENGKQPYSGDVIREGLKLAGVKP